MLINKIYRQANRYMVIDMLGERHGPFITFEHAQAVLDIKRNEFQVSRKRQEIAKQELRSEQQLVRSLPNVTDTASETTPQV